MFDDGHDAIGLLVVFLLLYRCDGGIGRIDHAEHGHRRVGMLLLVVQVHQKSPPEPLETGKSRIHIQRDGGVVEPVVLGLHHRGVEGALVGKVAVQQRS